MYLPSIAMVVASFVLLGFAVVTRRARFALTAGMIAWLLPAVYFAVEAFVISGSAVPYDPRMQPMSDLGVTTCDDSLKDLALRDICSPRHEVANWAFTLTGVAICAGTIWLHALWPKQSRRRIVATILLLVYGAGNLLPGVIPADLDFTGHVIGSLPGMFVQVPALILVAGLLRDTHPRMAMWTLACAAMVGLALMLLITQPFTGGPGGLWQRLLYFPPYLWGAVTAVTLWRHSGRRKSVAVLDDPGVAINGR